MKSKTHDREKGHHAYLAVAALILCATLWSFSGPLIKLLSGAGGHISPTSGIAIAFYRSLIGGLFFLPLAWSNRRSMGNVQRRWLVGSVASFTLMTGFFVIATTQTAAANAIVLQNTSAIWVFLLSPILLHERPSLTEGAVLLLAMTGVIIVFTGNGATDMSGLVIAMISGLGYGVLTVVLRALRPVDRR